MMLVSTYCEQPPLEGGFDVLRQLAERLEAVNRFTEQAFLHVGGEIAKGQQRASLLAGKAERLLDPEDRETAEQVVQRLQLLTERCALWLDESAHHSRRISASLARLQGEVASLRHSRDSLSKIVKILQNLRVATRIEAARSHGYGAHVLGQDLQGLSQAMQGKIDCVAERCEVLEGLLRRALKAEEQTHDGSLVAVGVEIGKARQLLAGIAGQCVRTTDQTAVLQRHSLEMAASFGELIAALQFQDITRQRLQHIAATLRQLNDCHAHDEGMPSGRICRLQYEQLCHAGDEFAAAVERLADNLRRMASEIQLLAGNTGAVAMAGNDEQLAKMEPSLQAVIASLQKVQTGHLAAGQALFALGQAVGDVSLLTDEVEQLAEEMQLLAQNAAISAAHGARQCVGITVIADNIQKLAEEAGRHTQVLTDRCRKVKNCAGELDDLDQQTGHRAGDLDALLHQAQTLITQFKEVGKTTGLEVDVLGSEARALGNDLATVVTEFAVQKHFREAIDPVLAGLESLAVRDTLDEEDRTLVDDTRRRYTMLSQRHIHRQVMSDDACGVAHALGDNVELF